MTNDKSKNLYILILLVTEPRVLQPLQKVLYMMQHSVLSLLENTHYKLYIILFNP